jgi:uncharacterized membrane protein YjgN (DUF898 family)
MEDQRTSLSFKADGMDLFALTLKNMLLSMCTFGIYSFWGKINIQKFLNRGTYFGEEALDFHGTGKEKFIGFLKGMGIITVLVIIASVATAFLGKLIGAIAAQVILMIIVYGAILLITPMIIVGKRRYFLSRSSWRGVRFIFNGRWKKMGLILLKGALVSILTLGIYIPWFIHDIREFMINNSGYGTEPFIYTGNKRTYAKTWWLGFLFSILTFGIYSFWLAAALERHFMNNTTFQGKKLSCSLTGETLFKTALINLLLIVFTFGVAASWVIVRNFRIWFGSISLEGTVDVDTIRASVDAKASALADGLSEAGDVFDTLADFIG